MCARVCHLVLALIWVVIYHCRQKLEILYGIEGGRVVYLVYVENTITAHDQCRQYMSDQERQQATFG